MALVYIQLSDEVVVRMYEQMVTLREMDEQLLKAQRMVGPHTHIKGTSCSL